MTSTRPTPTDDHRLSRPRVIAASILVAVLLVIELVLVAEAGAEPPAGTAGLVLALTGATGLLLVPREPPDPVTWLTLGIAVLAPAVAAVALFVHRPVLLLTISIGSTLALYSMRVVDNAAGG